MSKKEKDISECSEESTNGLSSPYSKRLGNFRQNPLPPNQGTMHQVAGNHGAND